MHRYISHSVFLSVFGGHLEHLLSNFPSHRKIDICECFLINPNAALIQSLQSLHLANSRAAGGAALKVVWDKGLSIFRQESIRQLAKVPSVGLIT
jgi:choline kinase